MTTISHPVSISSSSGTPTTSKPRSPQHLFSSIPSSHSGSITSPTTIGANRSLAGSLPGSTSAAFPSPLALKSSTLGSTKGKGDGRPTRESSQNVPEKPKREDEKVIKKGGEPNPNTTPSASCSPERNEPRTAGWTASTSPARHNTTTTAAATNSRSAYHGIRLRVLTFNVWGVFNSKLRIERLKHLASKIPNYDIIVLQEQFLEEDFFVTWQELSAEMRQSLYYKRFTSSFYGSGCTMISRFPIVQTFFFAFPLQGYPEMVLQGDFYAQKGVAMGVVLVPPSHFQPPPPPPPPHGDAPPTAMQHRNGKEKKWTDDDSTNARGLGTPSPTVQTKPMRARDDGSPPHSFLPHSATTSSSTTSHLEACIPVRVYTTHLVAVYARISKLVDWRTERYLPYRISQAISVAQFVASTAHPLDPIIIAGDFNCSPGSLELEVMNILLKCWGFHFQSGLPRPLPIPPAPQYAALRASSRPLPRYRGMSGGGGGGGTPAIIAGRPSGADAAADLLQPPFSTSASGGVDARQEGEGGNGGRLSSSPALPLPPPPPPPLSHGSASHPMSYLPSSATGGGGGIPRISSTSLSSSSVFEIPHSSIEWGQLLPTPLFRSHCYYTYADCNPFNASKTSYFKLLHLEGDLPVQIDHLFFNSPRWAVEYFDDCPDYEAPSTLLGLPSELTSPLCPDGVPGRSRLVRNSGGGGTGGGRTDSLLSRPRASVTKPSREGYEKGGEDGAEEEEEEKEKGGAHPFPSSSSAALPFARSAMSSMLGGLPPTALVVLTREEIDATPSPPQKKNTNKNKSRFSPVYHPHSSSSSHSSRSGSSASSRAEEEEDSFLGAKRKKERQFSSHTSASPWRPLWTLLQKIAPWSSPTETKRGGGGGRPSHTREPPPEVEEAAAAAPAVMEVMRAMSDASTRASQRMRYSHQHPVVRPSGGSVFDDAFDDVPLPGNDLPAVPHSPVFAQGSPDAFPLVEAVGRSGEASPPHASSSSSAAARVSPPFPSPPPTSERRGGQSKPLAVAFHSSTPSLPSDPFLNTSLPQDSGHGGHHHHHHPDDGHPPLQVQKYPLSDHYGVAIRLRLLPPYSLEEERGEGGGVGRPSAGRGSRGGAGGGGGDPMEVRQGSRPVGPSMRSHAIQRRTVGRPSSSSASSSAAAGEGEEVVVLPPPFSPLLPSASFSDGASSFVPLTAEEWQVVGHVQEILGTTALRFRSQHERLKKFALITAAVTGVVAVCAVVDGHRHRRLRTVLQNVFAHAMDSSTTRSAAGLRHRRRGNFSSDAAESGAAGQENAVQTIVTATKAVASAATKVVAQPMKVATEALTMHNLPGPDEEGGESGVGGGTGGGGGGIRNGVCAIGASLLRRVWGMPWHRPTSTSTIQSLAASLPAEYPVESTAAATLLPSHGTWTLMVLLFGPMVSVGAFAIGMLHRLGNAKLFEDQLELLYAVCGSAEEGRRREHQRKRRKGSRGMGMEEEEEEMSARSSGDGGYKDDGALGRRWRWKSYCGEERKAYGGCVPVDDEDEIDNEE